MNRPSSQLLPKFFAFAILVLSCSWTAHGQGSLPSGWSQGDVGNIGLSGNASYASGVLTVSGSGQSAWGTADQMHFVYQPLSGDGVIVGRVVSLTGGNYPEAGVMIRETLNANSTNE